MTERDVRDMPVTRSVWHMIANRFAAPYYTRRVKEIQLLAVSHSEDVCARIPGRTKEHQDSVIKEKEVFLEDKRGKHDGLPVNWCLSLTKCLKFAQ